MVFLFVLLILILLIFSQIRIKVENFKFSSEKENSRFINEDYNVKIQLIVLKFVPVVWININNKKIQKLKETKKIDFDFNKMFKNISKQKTKFVPIKIKKIHLNLDLGTDFSTLTTMIIPLVSTILSIILFKSDTKQKNVYYKISPKYNENIIKFELTGIFEIKMIHIINVICKGEWRDERSSNRRSYDYSHEQY